MSDPKKEAVLALTRRVIAEIAPEETLLDSLMDSIYEKVAKGGGGTRPSDASGFGGRGLSRTEIVLILCLGLLSRFQAQPGVGARDPSDSGAVLEHLIKDRKWLAEQERKVTADRQPVVLDSIARVLRADVEAGPAPVLWTGEVEKRKIDVSIPPLCRPENRPDSSIAPPSKKEEPGSGLSPRESTDLGAMEAFKEEARQRLSTRELVDFAAWVAGEVERAVAENPELERAPGVAELSRVGAGLLERVGSRGLDGKEEGENEEVAEAVSAFEKAWESNRKRVESLVGREAERELKSVMEQVSARVVEELQQLEPEAFKRGRGRPEIVGELGEIVLETILELGGEAHVPRIQQVLEEQRGKRISSGALHTTLRRLEEKGHVDSEWGEEVPPTGGRQKRIFRVTEKGQEILQRTRSLYGEKRPS